VQQLGRELVAALEGFVLGLALHGQEMFEPLDVVVRGLHSQVSLAAQQAVAGDRGQAVADGELRNPLVREPQNDARGVVGAVLLDRRRKDRVGLGLKDVARGVDAVNAEIQERTAALFGLSANVSWPHHVRESRFEQLHLAEPAVAGELEGLERRLLEVQPVSDHQLDASRLAGAVHLFALGDAGGERLFTEHVHPRRRSAQGELPVRRVRRCNVDGIDAPAAQHVFEARVVALHLELVLLAELGALLGISRDDRDELGVFFCVPERWQNSYLRNVPRTDHGVADLGFFVAGHAPRLARGTPA
jgi:hypothetical protein